MGTTEAEGVVRSESVGHADPEARSVADAEGEEVGDPELPAEREGGPVSLAVAHSEGVLEKVELTVAVSLPLGVIDGEPMLELEFCALREAAADDEALAATDGLTVGDTLALRDTVAPPLPLGAPLALPQTVAADEALNNGDAEGDAKEVAVEFQEGVARPLLLAMPLALGRGDAVPDVERVAAPTVAVGELLAAGTEGVAVADRLSVGVLEPEGDIEPQGDAEALARTVEQLDGEALLGKDPVWELLAQ